MSRLDQVLSDTDDYNAFLIDNLLRRPAVAPQGRLVAEVCRYFRAIGICRLLLAGDSDAFFHGLLYSAFAWHWYLAGSAAEGDLTHPARKASFAAPLQDALAADHVELADALIALAPGAARDQYEYEDDFLYAYALGQLGRSQPATDDEVRASLAAWEAVLEGGPDLRWPLCTALVERDSPAFDTAFLALAQERHAGFEKRATTETDGADANDYDFLPNWYVWVEGLALLRIAERRGLELRSEYPACPSLVRAADYAPPRATRFPPLSL